METGVRRAERGRGDGGMNEGERGCISPRSADTGIRTGGVMIIHRLLLALHFNTTQLLFDAIINFVFHCQVLTL